MRTPAAALLALALAPAAPAVHAAGLDPAKELTQYSLDRWGLEQGLPNTTVLALAQTPDGYLWLATYEGLARFDGVRFTVFHSGNTEGLASSSVRALAAAPDGTLWIGTHGGGLVRLRDGRFTRYTTAQGLPSDMVMALHVDGSGAVFAGTTAGLARMDGERATIVGPFRDSISAVYGDRSGSLWIGTHGAGVRRMSAAGEWDTFNAARGLPGEVVSSVHQDAEGTVWVGLVGGGLARLHGQRFRAYGAADGLPSDVVWSVMEDRRGTLWLATGGAGLVRMRDGRFTSLSGPEGLGETVLYSLLEDREGNLWAGSNGSGVMRLRDGPFTSFTTREGLSHDFVYAIREDAQGTLWAGTSDGLNRFDGRAWTQEPSCGGRLHNVVRSLALAPDGALWAGTYGTGVCRRDGGRWTTYRRQDGLAHDSVRSVLPARDGSIWVGTIGGLSLLRDGAWRTFTVRDGLPVNSVIALLEDSQGRLWVATDGGGIARYSDGAFERVGPPEGLPGSVVLALYGDLEGGIWAGTNSGLAFWRNGRFAAVTTRDGLPSDSIYQILDDGRGALWLGTSRGVVRLERPALLQRMRSGEGALAPRVFDRADGLKSAQCTAPAQPAGWRARDGRLWFATTRGLSVVDPAAPLLPEPPPSVLIEEVVADDERLGLDELRLEPGTGTLAFHYTATALGTPGRVRFRYRLEGLDTGWVDARERRVAYYSHLPPGPYTFRVVASHADGAWSEQGAALALEVRPRLYQTWWFTAMVALAVAGAVLGAHRINVRRLHARQDELTRLVDERTRSVIEAKERAERATAEAQRQRQIAEEANALKTELLGIAAHDLRNPLQLVSGLSELMSQGLATGPKVAEFSQAVYEAARRMLEIVNSLLTTAALDRGLELSRGTVDLGRLAASVLEEHGERAAAKGQHLVLEAEENCAAVVDNARIRQVLDNLVSNAIKFSPRGADVRVLVRSRDGGVRLEVRDNGPGLTSDDLQRAFGRFTRLSARPTGGEAATGLGLSIVKGLVELHGGRVWAESEGPGRGSTFVVELPRG
jgi:signal transduction histidine kinase/ligand-binding sensor domain-containing protein